MHCVREMEFSKLFIPSKKSVYDLNFFNLSFSGTRNSLNIKQLGLLVCQEFLDEDDASPFDRKSLGKIFIHQIKSE